MASLKDKLFDDCWPGTEPMILVRADVDVVAKALKADAARGDRMGRPWKWRLKHWRRGGLRFTRTRWIRVPSLGELFAGPYVLGGATQYALPTRSPWTVVWENDARCAGNDSLAWRLTSMYKLETLRFQSSDRDSTQLAGTTFTFRRPGRDGGEPIERSVYCASQGSRWHFHQNGEPWPEEDVARYEARRKRDRMNEEALMELLARMGARPWQESFYDLDRKGFQVVDPSSLQQVSLDELRRKCSQEAVPSQPAEDAFEDALKRPPDYAKAVCVPAAETGPGRLLRKGAWFGDAERNIFDVRSRDRTELKLRLSVPEDEKHGNPPFADVHAEGVAPLPIYDSRQHPGSVYAESSARCELQEPLACPKCGHQKFRLAVGFALHPDSSAPEDTSWTAIAAECAACKWAGIVFDDETH